MMNAKPLNLGSFSKILRNFFQKRADIRHKKKKLTATANAAFKFDCIYSLKVFP
jgi:hypothetical protein